MLCASLFAGMAPDPVPLDDALPPEIIAQAEAAIAANAADDVLTSHRRHSRIEVDPSQSDANLPSSGRRLSTGPSHSKSDQHPDAGELPSYGAHRDTIKISQDGFDTQAKVTGASSF